MTCLPETDALMRQAIEKGLEIEQEPKNDPFAYHMKIKDLDGNVLWLGTERKEGDPDAAESVYIGLRK